MTAQVLFSTIFPKKTGTLMPLSKLFQNTNQKSIISKLFKVLNHKENIDKKKS